MSARTSSYSLRSNSSSMDTPALRKRSASGPQQSGRAKRRYRSTNNQNKDISDDTLNGNHVVAKTPRACLGELPEEVVVNIFRHLNIYDGSDAKLDRNSLTNVCRVDKRCNRIATEVLYEEMPENQRAVRRIARDELLAKHVKVLGLHFGVSKTTKPIDILREENFCALRNACNVRTLSIYEHQKLEPQNLLWVNSFHNAVSSNHFAHLKSLAINASGMRVEHLSCVFRIPSLEKLELNGCYQHAAFEDWTVPKQSCNIQCLDFCDSFMDIMAIEKMISATKALKDFEYYYNPSDWEPLASEDNPMSRWPMHSWAILGKALREHKQSLEKLVVGDMADPELVANLFPGGRNLGKLGSLQDYPRLTVIAAPIDAFLDTELSGNDVSTCLPASLAELITWFHNQESVAACSVEAIGSLQKMPALKHLDLDFMPTFPFKDIRLSEPLFHLKAAGVVVVINHWNFSKELKLDDIMELEAGRCVLA